MDSNSQILERDTTMGRFDFQHSMSQFMPTRRRLGMPRRAGMLACLLSCLVLLFAIPTEAQVNNAIINREYPLKALFLYNFGSYIDWPTGTFAEDDTPFTIGVLGSTPLDESLQQIASTKTIHGRKIVVREFDNVNRIGPCQILFIPSSISLAQQRILIESLKNRPVLLVGESPSFAVEGGCMNFILQDNKIRFEVNVNATKERQLKVSSKLLSMAKIVPGENAPLEQK